MLEEKFVNHKLDCSLGKWVSFVTAQALSRLMTEVPHSEVHKTFSSGVSMTTVQCLQWIPVNVHFCPSVLDDSGGKGGQIFQRNEISCNLSVTRTHDILCSVDSHFGRKSCKFEKKLLLTNNQQRHTHLGGEGQKKPDKPSSIIESEACSSGIRTPDSGLAMIVGQSLSYCEAQQNACRCDRNHGVFFIPTVVEVAFISWSF